MHRTVLLLVVAINGMACLNQWNQNNDWGRIDWAGIDWTKIDWSKHAANWAQHGNPAYWANLPNIRASPSNNGWVGADSNAWSGSINNNAGATNVWSTGGNSVSVSCVNGQCRSCVNGRCYDRQYSNLTSVQNCPPVACETTGCSEVVWNTDNCPICKCSGFATREPCSNDQPCGRGGTCTNQLCRYPAVPEGLPRFCVFAHQCAEEDNCVSQKCQKDPAGRRHLMDRSCVFTNQCPSGYSCDAMTCWQSDVAHTGQSCVFDYQCPSQYSCQQMSCMKTGKEHGTTACVFASQCQPGQQCINMTCQ